MKASTKLQLFLASLCILYIKGIIPNGLEPLDLKFHDTLLAQTLENANYEDAFKNIDSIKEAWNLENITPDLEGLIPKEDKVATKYKHQKANYLYDPNALKKLVGVERKIYLKMKEYVENVDKRLKMFKDYIQDYEESLLEGRNDDFMEDLEHNTVANPLVSYRMMRRFALDLPTLYESCQVNYESEFDQAMIKINEEMLYPSQVDHGEALRSIIRIQRYTSLDPYELSNGKLGDLQTTTGLLPIHAFEIGIEARNQGRFAMAIEWFELALDKLDRNFTTKEEKLINTVKLVLRKTVETHDKEWDKTMSSYNDDWFTQLIGDNYGSSRTVSRVKTYDINRKQSMETRNQTLYSIHTPRNFVSLCSGQNFQSEAEKARLHCYYETKKHPFLRINPMKMELLHENPPLQQVYDFLGPQAINEVIQAATPRLERSAVIDYNVVDGTYISDVRTSSQTLLHENSHPVLQRAEKNIETLTGLRVKSGQCSETFQIANYGTSHHYDEHVDALIDESRTAQRGDRIATFMIYLSDVEVGGKTAFPSFGTAASPVKGSAVFWYNLRKNGEPDFRTWHGGCPVVYGNKWVANKWILSKCNWRSEPCTLN